GSLVLAGQRDVQVLGAGLDGPHRAAELHGHQREALAGGGHGAQKIVVLFGPEPTVTFDRGAHRECLIARTSHATCAAKRRDLAKKMMCTRAVSRTFVSFSQDL